MRGFLPSSNPFGKLAIKKDEYRSLVETAERLFTSMPTLIKEQIAREEIVCQLREVAKFVDHDFTETFGDPLMEERAFFMYAVFATVFVNIGKPLNRLAKEVTIPLVRMGARVQRWPTLDYRSYILCNWRLNGLNKEPIFTFSNTTEERDYIVSRILVEEEAADITSLDVLRQKLDRMTQIMRATPQFPLHVAYCLNPFLSVKYEGWGWTEPRNFVVPLVTQSPVISLVTRLLGIAYNDTEYINHRPREHNGLISAATPLEVTDVKTYNECVELFGELADMLSSPESNFMWDRFGVAKSDFVTKYHR